VKGGETLVRRKGSCLCGALSYEIEGEIDGVWMCHCSNCRKASGGTGNAIIIVSRERFFWSSGQDHRVTYQLRPTYSITRCKTCGTPLPAEEDEKNVYLTAGTLTTRLVWASRRTSFAHPAPTGITTWRTCAIATTALERSNCPLQRLIRTRRGR
jgi:hypothetical protein